MAGRLPVGGGGGAEDRVSGVGGETERGEESGLEWIDPGWKADNNWPVVKDEIWLILQGYFGQSNDVEAKWLHQLRTNSKDWQFVLDEGR
jgi:hypothetical protein